MRAAAVLLTCAAACGGAGKPPVGPATGTEVRVRDEGQIYDALNTTDCIAWPSPAIKAKAGRSGWGGFVPDEGLTGTVLAVLAHCDGTTRVVLVEVGRWVVPVTTAGVEPAPDAAQQAADAQALTDVIKVTEHGEGEGGLVGELVASELPAPGAVIEIVDPGFQMIDDFDCVTFPSRDVKAFATRAGAVAAGATGTVLATSPLCDDPDTHVVIAQVGSEVVVMFPLGIAIK